MSIVDNHIKITIIAVLFTLLSITQGVDAIVNLFWMLIYDVLIIILFGIITFISCIIARQNKEKALDIALKVMKFL